MSSLGISVPLSVVAETTIASVAVAETVSTIASVGESVASIAKAKTIGQGIPVASVVGISISIGLSRSSGLGLGLPLAVVSSGPVSTLVTSAMAVVVIVARLSEGDTGEEDGGDNEEFHDETSYQQQLQ